MGEKGKGKRAISRFHIRREGGKKKSRPPIRKEKREKRKEHCQSFLFTNSQEKEVTPFMCTNPGWEGGGGSGPSPWSGGGGCFSHGYRGQEGKGSLHA